MNINKKLDNIYNKLKNPKYIIKGWIVVQPEAYEKRKNKTSILNINNIVFEQIKNESVCNIICETKDKFLFFKYNSQFIGEVVSNNEYGLILNSYDIFAVNSEIFEKAPPFTKNKLNLKDVFNILGYKLSKKSKDYLDYFD